MENEETESSTEEHRSVVITSEEGLFRWEVLWEKTFQQRCKDRVEEGERSWLMRAM